MDPNDFTDLLTGLEIKAFDLSFDDSTSGVLLGTAKGLANNHIPSTANNSVNINNTRVEQFPELVVAKAFGFGERELLDFAQK